jgi:hypothetical protein
MKKISSLIGSLLIILFAGSLKAQEAVAANLVETHAATGTFQYVFKARSMEKEVILTDADLATIAIKRHEEKEIFVRYDENTLIKVLPKNVINNTGFDPTVTEEKLYYVELNMTQYSDIYKQAINLK